MRHRTPAHLLPVMILGIVIVGAALCLPFGNERERAVRALAALVGMAVSSAVTLVLTWKPRGVANLERDRDERAEDFLEKLEQGREAIPGDPEKRSGANPPL
jgi:hypothetical protein